MTPYHYPLYIKYIGTTIKTTNTPTQSIYSKKTGVEKEMALNQI
jgi:hypothetical protein